MAATGGPRALASAARRLNNAGSSRPRPVPAGLAAAPARAPGAAASSPGRAARSPAVSPAAAAEASAGPPGAGSRLDLAVARPPSLSAREREESPPPARRPISEGRAPPSAARRRPPGPWRTRGARGCGAAGAPWPAGLGWGRAWGRASGCREDVSHPRGAQRRDGARGSSFLGEPRVHKNTHALSLMNVSAPAGRPSCGAFESGARDRGRHAEASAAPTCVARCVLAREAAAAVETPLARSPDPPAASAGSLRLLALWP
ncbi:uncharacterized protein [Oryctolagus cuniculus]|uniref:uncharacterized protein n=1 Tax=Oryctolagus cuniculus TaxID=9986 RepID=UPI0038799983